MVHELGDNVVVVVVVVAKEKHLDEGVVVVTDSRFGMASKPDACLVGWIR